MQLKKLIFILFLCSHFSNRLMAASVDTISVKALLQILTHQQALTHQNNKFTKGTFPTFRTYHFNAAKPDDNIFYTALIVFTLRELYPNFNARDKVLVDSIIQNALPSFKKFKNALGRNTYNFWPTKPSIVFPNGGWLNLMNTSMALPDDMDDTVISLMALNTDSTNAQKVHLLMQQYVNLRNGKKNHSAPKILRHYPTYSTWFGDKMPVDFDICVLSNVLYFVYKNNLPVSKADSVAINFIKTCIAQNYLQTKSAMIAPHYQRLPVILYHLARLMSLPNFHGLDNERRELINMTHQLLNQSSTHDFDKIILSTALLKWHDHPFQNNIIQTQSISDFLFKNDFVFFKATMGSILPSAFKNLFNFLNLGVFNYYSPSYNIALLMEYLVLNKQYTVSNP